MQLNDSETVLIVPTHVLLHVLRTCNFTASLWADHERGTDIHRLGFLFISTWIGIHLGGHLHVGLWQVIARDAFIDTTALGFKRIS